MVYRMTEVYEVWGALKSVLSNARLGLNAKKCLYEGVRHCMWLRLVVREGLKEEILMF